MRRDLPITELMSRDVHSVQVTQDLSDVRKMMEMEPFHHLPVLEGRVLRGLLSSTDLARLSLEPHGASKRSVDDYLDHAFTIEQVMTTDPECLDEGSTLYDALDILANGIFHALPVVNDDDELIGIVTTTDVLRHVLDEI